MKVQTSIRSAAPLTRTLSLSKAQRVASSVLSRLDAYVSARAGLEAGGPRHAFAGLARAGLSNEVNSLRLALAAGSGVAARPSLSRASFAHVLPGLFSKVKAAPTQDLARKFGQALDAGYSQWAQRFSPLMNLATLARFAQQLQSATLGQNPLISELSRKLTAEFDRAVQSFSAQLGNQAQGFLHDVSGALGPQSLGRELSNAFGKNPLSFPPFDDLSSRARNELERLFGGGVEQLGQSLGRLPDQIEAGAQRLGQSLRHLPGDIEAGAQRLGDELSRLPNQLEAEMNRLGTELSQLPQTIENKARGFVDDVERGVTQAINDPLGTIRQQLPTNVTVLEGSVEASAAAWKAQGSVGQPGGPFYAEGSVAVLEARAAASGKVTANLRDLSLRAEGQVEASVDLIRAQGSFTAGNSEFLNAMGSGQARVGVDAAGQGALSFDPLHGEVAAQLGADAFVGARASAEVGATVGPVSARGQFSALAGVGVHYSGSAGIKDGKVSLGFDLGLSLGVGLRLKFQVSVDFKAALTAAKKVLGSVAKGLGKAGAAVGRAVKEGVKKAAKWVGNAAKKVGKAAKAVGHAVGSAAKAIGKGIKKLFKGW